MAKGAAAPPASLHKRTPKAITIAILAMGGEGGGVLADWIVDLAEHSGYRAQTTSVPRSRAAHRFDNLLSGNFPRGRSPGGLQRTHSGADAGSRRS